MLRGTTAVVGLGDTPFHKRGTSGEPALKLALRAIVAAAEDAGIDPADIDGFVSYGAERAEGQRMMAALGTRELRFGALAWTHGGGIPGALGLAATAIVTGQAEIVAVYRAMSEFRGSRGNVDVGQGDTPAQQLVNGIEVPAQMCALRTMRLIEAEGVPARTLRDMALVSYHHARNNPRAVGRSGLDAATYDASRWISEPYRLYDCSRENDAGSAVILVSAERAKDLRPTPAYLLGAPMGAAGSWGMREESGDPYWSAGFQGVADRLWRETGYGPGDVDVAQIYENMTGMGVSALIEHGFCTLEGAGEFVTVDNLVAPTGTLPVNTSGGNLAEGFVHGMSLVGEAVRQIRGTSCNQVPDATLSLMTGGPGDPVVSTALLAGSAAL
ncbi:3-ketoacyl-CoA thiolase [Pseudonocardia sp. Ae168_Ps1]|uniref:thiolase C-terminal domain-containing protein n=1 Tax=unclassified Pseudonocardia TaxID=2619320 RepID=UPI00094B5E16|nr:MULTISPECIES: transporter [unclassified Pseudonocardia]OLL75961.1 3-ketoacyl-CoA thiolase [Pseudonocardia sp. Ae150A_Ps1]OLL81959.1 3-ketoacyl-CoA thiolase [Pseudonocardia sp. Ae168_Ps1]OLL83928.1 3-ketoacyl-CoA thiolase [Pseudonocardia sp. Ae263_Ps1]OLL96053.1 3-ketoacyl-CoA thiolase [Pseudonocardia sp. Ae356_Ps1]